MRPLSILFAIILFPKVLWSQDSLHMNKVGHLTFPNILADVQGYVSPSGDEYALVGHEFGVSIVSLANPAAPVVIHDLPGVMTIWREIETFGQYAYATIEAAGGLRIIDMRGLPGSITYRDTILDTVAQAHSLYISDSVLYMWGTRVAQGADIFSLADPWNPVRIGTYTDFYVHDGYVRDKIGYLGQISRGHMTIVDFHDPANPIELGTVLTPTAFTHNTWLSDDGLTCYTTDELSGSWVTAYDVSDPANPEELDRIRPSYCDPLSMPHNVKVFNDYLVTAHYSEGVHVVDAHRPHNLVEVGYYDTYPHPVLGWQFEGVWGADPFLPSGLIVAGDRTEGLFILAPDYRRACYLEGTVTDASTGLAISNCEITFNIPLAATNSRGDGSYATGTVHPGVATVTYHKLGYRDSTITITFSPGNVVLADIPLQPASRVHCDIRVEEAGTGLPIPNAKIRFDYIGESSSLNGTTGGDGHFRDSSIIAAPARLFVGQWGHREAYFPQINFSGDTTMTIVLARGYEDGFELDFGWTTSGTASQGHWERGIPIGTVSPYTFNDATPPGDIAVDIGQHAYVTGNTHVSGALNSLDDDVDNGWVELRSPVMDLSLYQQPVIRIARWFDTEAAAGISGRDTLWIELDNGSQVVQLRRLVNGLGSWTRDTFLIDNLIPLTATMTFILRVKERQYDNLCEAGLDHFQVTGTILTDRPGPSAPAPGVTFTVAPNPVVGTATVSYDLGLAARPKDAFFELHDLTGRLLYQHPVEAAVGQFTMRPELPAGVYLASLRVSGRVVRHIRLLR